MVRVIKPAPRLSDGAFGDCFEFLHRFMVVYAAVRAIKTVGTGPGQPSVGAGKGMWNEDGRCGLTPDPDPFPMGASERPLRRSSVPD